MNSMSGMRGDIVPKGYQVGQLQNFTPQQMKLFKSLFSQLGPDSFLSRLSGGDESIFEQMEAPALRQFQELQGQLGSRFSGMGLGGRHSSGFQNTMSQATSDFAQQLASKRQELMRQAVMDLHGMSKDLLSMSPSQRFLIEKQEKPSFWQKLLGGTLRAGGTAAGAFFGGPAGAAAGYQAGNAAASGFGI